MANQSYITRPGGHDTTYVGPYTSKGASMRLYVLEGKYDKLKATLDRYLKPVAPKGASFVPLGDRFLGTFAAMEEVVGADPTLGSMREIDIAFLIPALRVDGIIPRGIVFFAPYLFVDIPQAQATGREIHGYRKEVGTSFSQVDTRADAWVANAADLTHVEAYAVGRPGERLKPQRLVDVTAPGAAGAPGAWPGVADALSEILGCLTADVGQLLREVTGIGCKFGEDALRNELIDLVKKLIGPIEIPLTIAFLRQFRDPRHTELADVQELVLADSRIDLGQLSGGKLPAGYAVTFHDQASHPFSEELGVADGVAIPSALTAECRCSFLLEEAR